jgi:hypothetical protein
LKSFFNIIHNDHHRDVVLCATFWLMMS